MTAAMAANLHASSPLSLDPLRVRPMSVTMWKPSGPTGTSTGRRSRNWTVERYLDQVLERFAGHDSITSRDGAIRPCRRGLGPMRGLRVSERPEVRPEPRDLDDPGHHPRTDRPDGP